ncbi:MAG TPA: redoxin domain-containing protein [Phnomibacter sp.]|nr:redoxin domain-containing protein [Phnomibacter sp.]
MNSFKSLFLLLLAACLCVSENLHAQDTATTCTIDVEIKPFQNQWVYLACYYGNIKSLTDSAWLNSDGKGAFKRKELLPQGVYMVVSPQKSILFEMMMGPDQQFSVVADTLNIESSLRISGSADNDLFVDYSKFLAVRVKSADSIQQQMKTATPAEQTKYNARMQQFNRDILNYREKVMNEHPDAVISMLFRTLSMVQYPPALAKPVTKKDTIAQYRYGKEHFWDGIDFMDGRLVRTPVFENKLNDYLENWIAPQADSVIFEFNWMIALGRNDDEMYKYLISYFVDHYMYPKIMGQDKVFLHVYEQYLSGEHPKVDWLNARQMKIITDRALMLMANQLGTKAYDINLPDTAGAMKSMYQVKAKYTVVAFWDVHCGKCREEMPRMDSLYQKKWKSRDVKIYAVMVNETSLTDWPSYIRGTAPGWVHVHQPTTMREAEEKSGTPNFRQLYDMRSTPTLYLLDANKMIVAKNVSLHDLDNLLDLKFAQ